MYMYSNRNDECIPFCFNTFYVIYTAITCALLRTIIMYNVYLVLQTTNFDSFIEIPFFFISSFIFLFLATSVFFC